MLSLMFIIDAIKPNIDKKKLNVSFISKLILVVTKIINDSGPRNNDHLLFNNMY